MTKKAGSNKSRRRAASAASAEARFFPTPAEFRAWLRANHARATELWVGLYKKGSGRPSIDWNQSVDEALCFGWIDGLRKSIDDEAYRIRFTPRKRTSVWSRKNLKRIQELIAEGRVEPPGLAIYEARDPEKTSVYSFEQAGEPVLDPGYAAQLSADRDAQVFFDALPPSARKACVRWVQSGKRAETRQRRLDVLIDCSRRGVRIPPLRRE